jgi:type IV pilus assembly protein PilC
MPDNLRKRRERLAQATDRDLKSKAAGSPPAASRRKKVSRLAKTVFTSQFATLQDAGLPVVRSLRVLQSQMPKGPLRDVTLELAEDVENGASLSEAFSKHPAIFDNLYVNMVRAGEASGALTTIFSRLAEFMEKAAALRRKIKGAMIYPTMVMIIAVLILAFIMIFVIPKFEETFSQLGEKLPGMTQGLIDTSRWMVENWYMLFLVPILIVGGLWATGRTAGGRRFLDRLLLRIPLFGPVIHKSQVAQFARTLGTLGSSGVPLMQSLEICADASGNIIMEEGIHAVRDAVREGEPMARPMAETQLFDEIVVNMVDVGEETGELDRMLMKIADNHEDEVEVRVGSMMAVLEPILIVTMAVMVGYIVIALFLPLLKLQESLGK